MYTHQDHKNAQGMEEELHKAHIVESKARTRGLNANAFFWVATGVAALVVAFGYAI